MLIGRPDVEAVLIYDTDFVSRGVYRDQKKDIHEFAASPVVNQRVVEQLRMLKAGDPASWSELLYIPKVKTVYASVAIPLSRDGAIHGYLIAAISTSRLSEIIANLVPTHGVIFLLDGGGRLIAHSKSWSMDLESMRTEEAPTVDPRSTSDYVLFQRSLWKPVDSFDKATAAGITISELKHDASGNRRGGPPFIVLTSPISGFGPKPWTIGLYFHGSDLGDEFMRVWMSIVAGIVALIVAVLLAVWLARRIARPLALLSKQASRIATLDIEDVSDLPPSRVREIDTTAGAFNAMLEGLRAFTLYVPRSLVAKLVQIGMEDTTRSCREAKLTMMFSDIVGFTTLSESLSAQETADLLNRHFEILVACVEAEGGTVDKFLGDGMLAFWGAPDHLEDHASAAIRAAQAIGRAVAADNAEAVKCGAPVIRVRIGIHTGPVIVGNIGTFDRVNYTIVGDNVNVCQRIETLGKEIAPGDEICVLASNDTIASAQESLSKSQVGKHHLRGRAAPVELWRIDLSGAPEPAVPKIVDAEANRAKSPVEMK